MHSTSLPANRKPVLWWLAICMLMVILMVAVGGVTRLTDSGLSMVNWKPLSGILPPLNAAEWEQEFSHYQQSPEYQQVNHGMSVDEFKNIFWLEYIHRLLGRTTGLVFFLPFAFFLMRSMLPRPFALRMGGIFILGGMQGLLGWYMVKSGLVNVPWVSPLRLMMHLSLAFIIFCCLWWQFMRVKWDRPVITSLSFPHKLILASIALLFLQIMLGAFVAGLDAGLLYDTFPTMNGAWVPEGIWLLEPWYRNFYENPEMAHFSHRLGALIVSSMIILSLRICSRTPKKTSLYKMSILASFVILALQIALGILTVIWHVPISIATLHQNGALLLLGALLILYYTAPEPQFR